jgi:hypothetical protein
MLKTIGKLMSFEKVFPAAEQEQLTKIRERQVAIQAFWKMENKKIGKINCSSGYFITDQLIITAAHNVFNLKLKAMASDVRVVLYNE